MNIQATGRYSTVNGQGRVVLTRTFRAPIADVWAAVTDPERLARWIGTWTGDPATRSVQFRMTAEGDDVAEETFHIDTCQAPHRLAVHTGDIDWELTLELTEQNGITTLEFGQVIDDPAVLDSVGPGWEYYLDRLVAAESGRDVAAITFEPDYYPALSSYYAALPIKQ